MDVRLLGHLCPQGRYPALVWPVVATDVGIRVVYESPGNSGFELAPLSEEYIPIQSRVEETIINPGVHRLLALDWAALVVYARKEEATFLAGILRGGSLANADPLSRLSIAKLEHGLDNSGRS